MPDNKKSQKDRAYHFAVRRLVRTGSITQSIILSTIGCSKSTANIVLNMLKLHDHYVEQRGHHLCLRENIQIENHLEWSRIASEQQLIAAIEQNKGMEFTGLDNKELPYNEITWSSGYPDVPNLMTAITKCLFIQNKSKRDHRSAIMIQYVDLNKGDYNRWLTVLPLGLERVMGQMRLIAQNLDKDGGPIQSFVLSRITDYKSNTRPIPKNLNVQALQEGKIIVSLELNHELTMDQEKVVRTELKLPKDKNTLEIDRRVKLDFMRHYSDAPSNDTTIWPTITSIKEGF